MRGLGADNIPGSSFDANGPSAGPELSSLEYQNFLHQHISSGLPPKARNTENPEEELSTPAVVQSNGYPKFRLSNSVHKKSHSTVTGLKPATAVRLKSLPWNFQPVNYEVATTATSHSRRTTDNMPIHNQFQYNLHSLEGKKPSTSSATGQFVSGQNYVPNDGLAQHSNLTKSREDDLFSNLTVSNTNQNNGQSLLNASQHTPTSINKSRMKIQPLNMPPGHLSAEQNGRATAQRLSSYPFREQQTLNLENRLPGLTNSSFPTQNSLMEKVAQRLANASPSLSSQHHNQTRRLASIDFDRGSSMVRTGMTPSGQQRLFPQKTSEQYLGQLNMQ